MLPPVAIPDDLAQRLEPLDADGSGHAAGAGVLEGFSDAAVLAIVLPRPQPRLLLIERAATLRDHAGQLAFPGGKRESEDATLVDTAVREAEEEVGLQRGDATVLGRLHSVPTPSKFLIHPFVAVARTGWEPTATSSEVAALVVPTLAQLADERLHRVTGRGTWYGYPYEMHEFAIHDPPLWGASARMTWELLKRWRR